MYIGKRWVPDTVADYFMVLTVIVLLLVGIVFLWARYGTRLSRKTRSTTAPQTTRVKRKRHKRR